MLQLNKTTTDSEDKRKDNSDKKELFGKEQHPHPANFYKDQWGFVQNTVVRENIAYQMQYLEFMVNLYNNYQIYLTAESLLFKDILATVGGIVEAVLFDLVKTARKNAGVSEVGRTDFTVLLGEAFHAYNLIDEEAWHFFHELRKVRNFVHLNAADFREHTAYTIEETNEALTRLESFRLNNATK